MHKFTGMYVSLACAAAVFSAPAMATVSGIFTTTTGSLTIVNPPLPGGDIESGTSKPNVGLEGGSQSWGSAAVFSSTANVDSGKIAFRDGNSAAGFYSEATSHTVLKVTLTNDSGNTVTPVLNSTILGAGMGWFVGDKSCLDELNSCGPTDNTLGGSVLLQDFAPSAYNDDFTTLGGASFDFKISGGGSVLLDLSGSFTLLRDLGTGTNYMVADLNPAAQQLLNIQTISDPGSYWSELWDPTNVTLNFANPLGAGQSTTLTYETTVSSYSSSECDDACLVTYAAFGDPIGRGGGTTGDTGVQAFALGLFGFNADPDPDPNIRFIKPPEDDPLAFPETDLGLPTFENGVITLTAIPELSTWLMMICGFAFVGARMRTRRRPLASIGAW